ncbi:hypothetical protein ACSV9I_07270 [Rhizobium sp. G187]
MSFRLTYTPGFYLDLERLTDFLIERDPHLAEPQSSPFRRP